MSDAGLSRFPDALRPRIREARIAAKPLAKTSRNAEFGYSYASSDSIVAEAREILAAVGIGFGFRLDDWQLIEGDLTDSATGAGWARVEIDLEAPDASHTEGIKWPIIIGRRNAGGPMRPLDKALSGAFTTAQGILLRGVLGLDRSDPSETMDGRDEAPKPVREARRDNDRRDRKNPPREAADAARPSPPPTDGVDRLAREERLSVLRGLIKRMPSHDAAAHELGFADLAEIKTLGMDDLVRATRVLTTWLEERAKAQAAAPTEAAPDAAPQPPPGPPEGSPEYYAARAAAKGPRNG